MTADEHFDDDEGNDFAEDRDGVVQDERGQLCGCGRETAFEACGFCGAPLCPMCFELGGGFCNAEHTQDQIDQYTKDVYGVETTPEQKRVRTELKQMGLI